MNLEEYLATGIPQAAAGATMLDEQKPGWVSEIDVERLDMRSAASCIIGQLYGYWSGRYDLIAGILDVSPQDIGFYAAEEWVIKHGFSLADDVMSLATDRWEAWQALTEAWKREIAKRPVHQDA